MATKKRTVKNKKLVPKTTRGVLPPRSGFRTNGSRLKDGGCKK